jgi:copper homeostasis protein
MPVLVEACVDSVASALAAERGGARRLELCAGLHDGGITPSAGMISAVKIAVRIPVYVLIRPRGGGFVFTDEEVGVMRLDVEAARMLGADGVVIGALTRDARVDVERVKLLVAGAAELPVTFHRAFDQSRDLDQAAEALVQNGVSRVLTSGGHANAVAGIEQIRALVDRWSHDIEIMAGGGIREENVREIVDRTGVHEVHVRGTRLARTHMSPRREDVRLRKVLPDDEGAWEETDEQRISAFVRLANA